MKDYAVLGDPQTCAHLRLALRLSRQGLFDLDEDELEIQDEWACRRWFARNPVAGVFICTGLLGATSVANFMFTMAGSLNVIRAAAGNVPRLILVSSFPSAEFFLLNRLLELYHAEKSLDFYSLVRVMGEGEASFANRCVLCMQDVSAEKAHQAGTEGSHKGREVRDQVVPQPASGQGDQVPAVERNGESVSQPAADMLEMQEQKAKGAAPGDLRAELAEGRGPATAHSLHPHAGPV